MRIDINFPKMVCPDCESSNQVAVSSGNRYAIRCSKCSRFIKWADPSQAIIIKARKAFLEGRK